MKQAFAHLLLMGAAALVIYLFGAFVSWDLSWIEAVSSEARFWIAVFWFCHLPLHGFIFEGCY